MLILLPPSETKAPGGEYDAMSVSFPVLDSVRASLFDDLSAMDVDEMMALLKIPKTKREEAVENQSLRSGPVMPAIYRYTGVLYDALDPETLPDEAVSRLAVGSALFGVVRAGDMIPRYRVSASSKVPSADGSLPTMRARWGSAISEVLAREPFVVDMRSGAYEKLGPVDGAVTVRVESVAPDGSRKVVSHFNKHYKGLLARALARGPEVASIGEVAEVARAAGYVVETDGLMLTLVVEET